MTFTLLRQCKLLLELFHNLSNITVNIIHLVCIVDSCLYYCCCFWFCHNYEIYTQHVGRYSICQTVLDNQIVVCCFASDDVNNIFVDINAAFNMAPLCHTTRITYACVIKHITPMCRTSRIECVCNNAFNIAPPL